MKTHNAILMQGVVFALLLWSCHSGKVKEESFDDSFSMLAEYIEKHTDFIHSEVAPAVLEIDALIEGTGQGIHVIDLRPVAAYDTGHFPGAVNVSADRLLDYLEHAIDAASFDTIALISGDGQDAFFAGALLRLLGYNNIYSVRFGMGWHTDYAHSTWGRVLSSDGEQALVTGPSPEDRNYGWPVISTLEQDPYRLLRQRVAELLNQGFDSFRIIAGDVLAAPESFFIINYWPENEYQVGHIPGSRQYTPKKSLQRSNRLGTLPPDQPVLIYCHQGNNSATVVAYLRLLGYDAYSMDFGTNSFMYDLHSREIKRALYRPDAVKDFPLEGSGDRSLQRPAVPLVKEVQGEGGC
jgi:rhodanese-related sulfurtransferase